MDLRMPSIQPKWSRSRQQRYHDSSDGPCTSCRPMATRQPAEEYGFVDLVAIRYPMDVLA
jgi:hypothetical protein